jgi:hypothetical protein
MREGFYCYVPLCQAPKTVASRVPEREMFICYGEPPGMFDRGPWSLLRVVKEVGVAEKW